MGTEQINVYNLTAMASNMALAARAITMAVSTIACGSGSTNLVISPVLSMIGAAVAPISYGPLIWEKATQVRLSLTGECIFWIMMKKKELMCCAVFHWMMAERFGDAGTNYL